MHDRIYFRGYDHTPSVLPWRRRLSRQPLASVQMQAKRTSRAQKISMRDISIMMARLQNWTLLEQSLPNDARVFHWMGSIQRRQGHWDESTRNLERAVELNPRDIETLHQIAISYDFFRRYAEEASLLDRALAIEPDHVEMKDVRAFLEVDWKADTQPLHKAIEEIRARNPDGVRAIASDWLVCALAERDAAAAKEP